MASTSRKTPCGYETSETITNTTFVHAEPSNFRSIVQHLTGSPSSHSSSFVTPHNLPSPKPGSQFKLLERRQAMSNMRKLEMIKLNNYHYGPGPSTALGLVSPVSTLDGFGRASPRTPTSNVVSEDEQRAIIAEKGFYLHPFSNSFGALREGHHEPQLLPLFPLRSPRQHDHNHAN